MFFITISSLLSYVPINNGKTESFQEHHRTNRSSSKFSWRSCSTVTLSSSTLRKLHEKCRTKNSDTSVCFFCTFLFSILIYFRGPARKHLYCHRCSTYFASEQFYTKTIEGDFDVITCNTCGFRIRRRRNKVKTVRPPPKPRGSRKNRKYNQQENNSSNKSWRIINFYLNSIYRP